MIVVNYSAAPTVDPWITEALDSMYPRVFLKWNPRFKEIAKGRWDARWEIWCELIDNSHPGIRGRVHGLNDGDKWNTDAQCWMRKLQAYQTVDYEFAPVDGRLIVGLEMADTWANRRFFEDHFDAPEAEKERLASNISRDAIGDAARYYRKFENPIVGAHFNSGWRGKLGLY